MLQSVINTNSLIHQQLCRIERDFQDVSVQGLISLLSSVSWGIDAPRKSYSALTTLYGALNTLYMNLYLDQLLSLTEHRSREMKTVQYTLSILEAQIERYARYIQGKGRDRI